MKEELLTKKLRKIAQDIALLSYDMENNKSRQRFFSDLIKQRVFELYDVLAELNSDTSRDLDSKKEMQFIKKDASREMYRTEELAKQNQKVVPEVKEELSEESINQIIKESLEEEEAIVDELIKKELESESSVIEELKPEITEEESREEIVSTPQFEQDLTMEEQEVPEIETIPTNNEKEQELQVDSEKVPEPVAPEPEIIPEEKLEKVKTEIQTLFDSNPIPQKPKNSPLWVEIILEEFLQKINQIGGVAAKQQNSPINSLTAVISISQKHEFINGLFAGDVEAYKKAITQIESCKDLNEALLFAENNLVDQFAWKHKEKLASEFVSLIRRRKLE